MDTKDEITRKMIERLRLGYPVHLERVRSGGIEVPEHLATLESRVVDSGIVDIVYAQEAMNEAIKAGDSVAVEKYKAEFEAAREKCKALAEQTKGRL
jgi:hypothetical protein